MTIVWEFEPSWTDGKAANDLDLFLSFAWIWGDTKDFELTTKVLQQNEEKLSFTNKSTFGKSQHVRKNYLKTNIQ